MRLIYFNRGRILKLACFVCIALLSIFCVQRVASADEDDAGNSTCDQFPAVDEMFTPSSLSLASLNMTCGDDVCTQADSTRITMYRLYNKYTGEHFYTSKTSEKDNLVKVGWTYEGVGWYAPNTSKTPVYRLYNSYVEGGDHHYTTDKQEYKDCIKDGWTGEGTGWYSVDATDTTDRVPVYRQYNPYAKTGTHNYTQSKSENDNLVSKGWKAEGTGWYGYKTSTPSVVTKTYKVTFNSNGGSSVSAQTIESGKKATKPTNPTKSGQTFVAWFTNKELTLPYDFTSTTVGANVTLYAKWQSSTLPTPNPPKGCVTVYQMINQTTGVHFYTQSATEVTEKVKNGWTNEGVAWYAPSSSNTPVYRLYDKTHTRYYFTTDAKEKTSLVSKGWSDEGMAFYSADEGHGGRLPIYQLYNPFDNYGDWVYTPDKSVNDDLVNTGYKAEGLGWYGVSENWKPEDSYQSFVVYSADDNSLSFYHRNLDAVEGEKINGKTATKVYTDLDTFPGWKSNTISKISVLDEGIELTDYFAYWFSGLGVISIEGLDKLDVSKVTSLAELFSGCSELKTVSGLKSWDTSKVTDISYMFAGCTNLTAIDGIKNWNTSKVSDMSSCFSGCKALATLDLSGWNLSSATNLSRMFGADVTSELDGCESMTTLNLTNWATAKVTYMEGMFEGCKNLSDIKGIGDLDTSNAISVACMFKNCQSLTTLDLSKWKTGNVGYDDSGETAYYGMEAMFYGCSSLTSLNATGWDVSKAEMFADVSSEDEGMFQNCSNLTTITGIEAWDTSSAFSMTNMFNGCTKLTADCSGWNVDQVEYYENFNQNATNVTAPTWKY